MKKYHTVLLARLRRAKKMPLFESNQATKTSSKNKSNTENQEVLFKEDSTSSLFGKHSNSNKNTVKTEPTKNSDKSGKKPLFSTQTKQSEERNEDESNNSKTLFESPNIEKKKFKIKNRPRIKKKDKPLIQFKKHKPKKTFLD